MNFFDNHGVFVLLALAVFPRITLLVASFATGGLFWWIGWVFAPHLLVAILSLQFWDTNPVLVMISWFVAIVGTGAEQQTVSHQRRGTN